MEIDGEFRIPKKREEVWLALNNPETLSQCIPGCESIERVSDTEFVAKIVAKIGPVKSSFDTLLTLSNINPPESYTLTGEGKGGVAGFAFGSASVRLESEDKETILFYSAQIQPGGKLAQVGSRLIGGTAKKLSGEFFSKFTDIVTAA